MILELHDASPVLPGEKHGPAGPTHCGRLRVGGEHELQLWLDSELDHHGWTQVVRVVDREGNREWVRSPGGPFSARALTHVSDQLPNHPMIGARVRWHGTEWQVRRVFVMPRGVVSPWSESATMLELDDHICQAVVPIGDVRALGELPEGT